MTQRQLPSGALLDGGTAGKQAQSPDGGFVDEVSALVPVDITVPRASLTLTGHAPTVSVTNDIFIAVPLASLTLTGHAPSVTLSAPRQIIVPRGTLTLTGHPPFVRVRSATAGSGGSSSTTTSVSRRGLLLTDDLPLQLTSQIGSFAAAQALPQRYGDLRRTRFKLIRMTSTKFIAAGHAMKSITRAFTGDLQTESFETYVESAGSINYQVVEFAAPVPLTIEATASGEGKLHPVTGVLIENPADIMADVLLLAGRTDPWFGQLRAEASAAGIVLAGSFTAVEPIRDALDRVTDSCGAIWCPGMARLYPAPFTADAFRIEFNGFNAHDMKISASDTDIADTARIAFDFDEAEDRNQSFIQLEAAPQRFGGKLVDFAMPMIRSAAVAEAVGRRVLPRYAGERYDLGFVASPLSEYVRPGTWALLAEHPDWPFTDEPTLMLASATLNPHDDSAEVTAEALVSSPTITLTKHSLGSNSIGAGGVEVEVRNGIATFTLLDNNDKPLVGAYASLDGSAPKKTNGQGQVEFVTTAGEHELAVEAQGFVPYSIGVTL